MKLIEDGKRYELRFLPTEMKKQIEECFFNTNFFTQSPST
jgi:hypothetical protein